MGLGAVGRGSRRNPVRAHSSGRPHPHMPAWGSVHQVRAHRFKTGTGAPGPEGTIPVPARSVAGPPPEAASMPIPAGSIEGAVQEIHRAPDQGGAQHDRPGIPAIHDRGRVARHQQDVRVDRPDRDQAVLIGHDTDRLGVDQASRGSGPLAKPLDGIVQIGGLVGEGLAQGRRPSHVLSHHGQHIRNQDQHLDARIPGAPLHGVGHFLQRAARVRLDPLMSRLDLGRPGRGQQDVAQKRIGVQGHRGQQPIQCFGVEALGPSPCGNDQQPHQQGHGGDEVTFGAHETSRTAGPVAPAGAASLQETRRHGLQPH